VPAFRARKHHPILCGSEEVSFEKIFSTQKAVEEESTGLSDLVVEFEPALLTYERSYNRSKPRGLQANEFYAKTIATCFNQDYPSEGVITMRGFLFQKIPLGAKVTPTAVGMALARYLDRWVKVAGEKLRLRSRVVHKQAAYFVERVVDIAEDDQSEVE
jgi:hypothetical protein